VHGVYHGSSNQLDRSLSGPPVLYRSSNTGSSTSGYQYHKGNSRHTLESRAQSSGLHMKLDHIESSIGMLRNSVQSLSNIQLDLDPDLSKTEMERAACNILSRIWLLISSLQLLIRELLFVCSPIFMCRLTDSIRTLLAPNMIAFYRNMGRGLLQYGDHFLFEDALGRIKKLPCAQFQH
jgi:hypothetical protein